MRRRIPTVNVAVAMTVPTIQRMSLVSKCAISARTPAISVRCSVRSSAICVEKRVSRAGDLRAQLGQTGLELVGGDVVALLDTLADGVGDDFGLVAGDAAGSELLGDGERVEHGVSLACSRRGRRTEMTALLPVIS